MEQSDWFWLAGWLVLAAIAALEHLRARRWERACRWWSDRFGPQLRREALGKDVAETTGAPDLWR